MKAAKQVALGAVLPVAGLLVWQWVSSGHGGEGSVSPVDVLSEARALAADGTLLAVVAASLQRYVAGLALGTAAGVLAGLLLGMSRGGRVLFGPTLYTLQQVTLFAWVPLLMAWFGLGEPSKVAFVVLAAVFPVMVNTAEGVRGVAPGLIDVGRVFGFGRIRLSWKVVLPAALPSILAGVRLAVIYAWLATLGAEYLMTAGQGLGNLLVDGQEQFRTDQVLVGIALVAAIGFLLGSLVERLETGLLRWRQPV